MYTYILTQSYAYMHTCTCTTSIHTQRVRERDGETEGEKFVIKIYTDRDSVVFQTPLQGT